MFCSVLYYGFARHLPKSTAPLIGGVSCRIRRAICIRLFSKDETHLCHDLVVEQGAYFGDGKKFLIGDHVGLGKNFKSLNRIVTIGLRQHGLHNLPPVIQHAPGLYIVV